MATDACFARVSGKADENDLYNTKLVLLRTLEHLKVSTSETNLRRIKDFLRRAEIENVGTVQRIKYLYGIKTLFEVVHKEFEEYTKEDLEEFLLHMKKYSTKTAQTRWYSVVKLLRFLGRDEVYREIRPSFRHKGMKLPEDILTVDEVQRMAREAYNARDKALISVLYESGTRIGEILPMRVKDVAFDEYGAVLMTDGKTGMRRMRIVNVKELKDWLYFHPSGNNPEAFLWSNLYRSEEYVGYGAVSKMLKETAERCGIKKRIHPHLFRHSRATHLANKLTESQMRIFFGWTGGSKMSATYVHLSGRDVDEAILEMNGLRRTETHEDPEFKEFMREMYSKWKATKAL